MTLLPPHINGSTSPEFDRSHLRQFVQCIDRELLPQIQIQSNSTHNNPVVVKQRATGIKYFAASY